MMKLIGQLLRGVVIGVANIIPGVSGGTMMVSMGIYDTLIHCITHLFKEFKQSVKTLLPYAVGMLVGILALAALLTFCFDNYPLPTATTFIGLILGGLAPLIRKIDKKRVNAAAVLIFAAFFALIIVLAVVNPAGGADTLSLNVGQMGILLVMGVIASATMLIPGVSGSMVLMLMGYYQPVLGAVNGLKGVLKGDWAMLGYSLGVLIPFGIGVLLGIYFVAKLIEWLIAKYPTYTYCGVLGLVIASPIAILLNPQSGVAGANLASVLVSIVTFAVGFVAAAWMAKSGEKYETESAKE